MATWQPAGKSRRRPDRAPRSSPSGCPPTSERPSRRPPTRAAAPTSTSGAAPSACGQLARRALRPRLQATGSGSSGRASRRSPTEGGALLVANHAGAIPSDAPVIMHGIEEELGRPVYGLADYFFRTRPLARHAAGPAPAACRPIPTTPTGCCATRGSSCSSSPRARRDRPRPTPTATGSGASGAAASSRSPCGPASRSSRSPCVGAEESMPIVFRLPALAKALGVPYFPVTANMLAARARSESLGYFPAKFKLAGPRPGHLRRAARPGALLQEPGHGRGREASGTGAGDPLRHAARPPQRLVRLSRVGRRVLITGLDTFWGGRMAQALESDPEVEMILGLGTEDPSVALRAHRVRPRPTRPTRSSPASSGPPRSTRSSTPSWSSTRPSARPRPARDQRHRHDEPPRRRRPARIPVRQVVVKSSTLVYGSADTDPALVPRGARRVRTPPRTRVERSLLEVEGLVRDFAEDNPHASSPCCASPTCSAPTSSRRSAKNLSRPLCPSIAGFDPLRAVRRGGRRRPRLEHVTRHRIPGVYNVAGARQAAVERGGRDLRHPAPAPPAGPPTRLAAAPLVRLGSDRVPARARSPPALRPRRRHPPAADDRLRLPLHHAPAPSRTSSAPSACAGASGRPPARTPTSTTSSSSSGTRRPSSRPGTAESMHGGRPPPSSLPLQRARGRTLTGGPDGIDRAVRHSRDNSWRYRSLGRRVGACQIISYTF